MDILVAEDETDIRNLLKLNLEQEGYHVSPAADGLEALDLVENNKVDLAILDIMMPKLDGFNLLRRIRTQYKFPVILLTARGDDMDKVLGLGLGADDYLVKPFRMAELMARVAAQLRRSKEYYRQEPLDDQTISFGELVLDKKDCTIRRGDSTIELNAKEYLILPRPDKNVPSVSRIKFEEIQVNVQSSALAILLINSVFKLCHSHLIHRSRNRQSKQRQDKGEHHREETRCDRNHKIMVTEI